MENVNTGGGSRVIPGPQGVVILRATVAAHELQSGRGERGQQICYAYHTREKDFLKTKV